MKKLFNVLSLICNVIIVVLVSYSIFILFTLNKEENVEVSGIKCFRYFTVLSNVLVAISSLIYLFFNINNITKNNSHTPFGVLLFKNIGTVSVTVTFLTVVLFLGPTQGYSLMFEGVNLILHAIVPIIAIISFTMFEVNKRLEFKHSLYGLLPTFIYSIVYIIMVVVIKNWIDFYGFTFGGKMYMIPVSIIMMYLATFLFSVGLLFLHNIFYKRCRLES